MANPEDKKSKKRIETLEQYIVRGIEEGVAACETTPYIPEILKVLSKLTYQWNDRHLDGFIKDLKNQNNKKP